MISGDPTFEKYRAKIQ